MTETWSVMLGLAAGTFAIRLGGVLAGRRVPAHGAWARGLRALPGCLIISLVSVAVVSGGPREWAAGLVAAAAAIATRNLPLTMAAGLLAIWALRRWGG